MAVTNACILAPVRFTAASQVVRVTLNAVTEDLTMTVVVDRNYYISGDATADASTDGGVGDLLALFDTMLNTHTSTGATVWAVSDGSADGSNVITITNNTNDFSLLWTHANTTMDPTVLGWTTADVTSSSGSLTAPNQTQGIWFPNAPPQFDGRDRTPVVGAVGRSISGLVRVSKFADGKVQRDLRWHLLAEGKALREYEAATEPTGSFEEHWLATLAKGRRWRYYADATSRTSSSFQLYRIASLDNPLTRNDQWVKRWNVAIQCRGA